MAKKSENVLIAALFPDNVVTSAANPALCQEPLYPEEARFIRNAGSKRRKEFIAGRMCARRALAKCGITNFPLLMGSDRAPVWPSGIVGTIAHTDGYCGVAIAPKTQIKSLGFDVECMTIMERDFWKQICTHHELSWINSFSSDVQEKLLFLVFCAKECLYKCQYTISKQWLNFHDVEIAVEPDSGEFEARFLVAVSSFFTKRTRLKGKFLFNGDHVFAGMALTDTHNHGVI